jgi:predicted HicB family RNase H-like nuclease
MKAKPRTVARATRTVANVEKKRLTLDIPEDVHRMLKIHAAEHGTSITEVVLSAIDKQVFSK